VSLLFAGRFVDWLDTKKRLWAIGIWSIELDMLFVVLPHQEL
jgi:hypothetical protein